jgi:hypothetical protein
MEMEMKMEVEVKLGLRLTIDDASNTHETHEADDKMRERKVHTERGLWRSCIFLE